MALPEHVGVDFGNYTVKAVYLKNISTAPELVTFGDQTTPIGVVNSEDPSHQQKLADVMKSLWDEGRFRSDKVVAALPESLIFTRFLEFPGIKEEELDDAVHWQAKQVVPIPLSDVVISSIILGKGVNDKTDVFKVLLVAAPKKIIDLYMNVLQLAKLEPIALETEAIAAGRAIYKSGAIRNAIILDFGSQSTVMSMMNTGNLIFSQSISVGSDALTRAIATEFSFEHNQAEEYKRNYGIQPDQLEGKIYNSIKPVMDSIIAEVRRGIEFYKTRTMYAPPKNMVLIGDGALLPGLVVYLAKEFGSSVELGNPFKNISISKKHENALAKGKAAYTVSIGLALKDE
jgi:type IV pilus assembly protein PilM